MANLTSTLTVRLINAVSGPAKAAASSLLGIGKAVDAVSGRRLFGGALGQMRDVERHAGRVRDSIRGMSAALTMPVGFAGAFGAHAVYELEKTTNAVQAVTEATREQVLQLRRYAQTLSPLFGFSTNQIMQSGFELAKSGLTIEQIHGALRGTLNMARAGDIELRESTDITTNVLTAMRLPMRTNEEIAKSLKRVNDVLSYTANQTNTDVRQLGETLKYVAPIGAAAGLSLEEIAAMAGVMANNGIRGSEAGVAMRSALVRMVRPTRQMSAALARLNVNLSDFVSARQVTTENIVQSLATGGISVSEAARAQIGQALRDPALMRDRTALQARLTEIIAPGAGAMDAQALSDTIRGAINIAGNRINLPGFMAELHRRGATVGDMARIFDQRQGGRLETLRVGAHGIQEFLGRLEREAPGSTDRNAAIRMQGVVGAWSRFTASINKLLIAISESGVLQHVTDMLNSFSKTINELAKTNPAFLRWATYSVVIAALAGPMLTALAGIVHAFGAIILMGLGIKKLLGASAGAGAIGAGAAGAGVAGAAKKGLLRRLLFGPLGIAGMVAGGLSLADREGNLFGLTRNLDKWIYDRIGINPSATNVGDLFRPPSPRQRETLAGILDRERADAAAAAGSVPLSQDTISPWLQPKGAVDANKADSQSSGRDAGRAFVDGVAAELSATLPAVVERAMREASRNLRINPTINVTPKIDGGALRGSHADVGVGVTR